MMGFGIRRDTQHYSALRRYDHLGNATLLGHIDPATNAAIAEQCRKAQ